MATEKDASPREGQLVVTSDGIELGHVREVRNGHFKVDAPRARDYWLSNAIVNSAEPRTLRLSLTHKSVGEARSDHLPGDEDAKREHLLRLYAETSTAILSAVEHVDNAAIDAPLPKSSLTLRGFVHELANTELFESVRLRRMLAENIPVLENWDKALFSRHLHYELPVATSLHLFRAVSESNIAILKTLSDAEWKREGNQQRPVPLTIETWLEQIVSTLRSHLAEITEARATTT